MSATRSSRLIHTASLTLAVPGVVSMLVLMHTHAQVYECLSNSKTGFSRSFMPEATRRLKRKSKRGRHKKTNSPASASAFGCNATPPCWQRTVGFRWVTNVTAGLGMRFGPGGLH